MAATQYYTSIKTGRLVTLKPEAMPEPYRACGEAVPSVVRTAKGGLYTTKKAPSIERLERYADDGIVPTPCGCRVEPDGECEHGIGSWLVILGYI